MDRINKNIERQKTVCSDAQGSPHHRNRGAFLKSSACIKPLRGAGPPAAQLTASGQPPGKNHLRKAACNSFLATQTFPSKKPSELKGKKCKAKKRKSSLKKFVSMIPLGGGAQLSSSGVATRKSHLQRGVCPSDNL